MLLSGEGQYIQGNTRFPCLLKLNRHQTRQPALKAQEKYCSACGRAVRSYGNAWYRLCAVCNNARLTSAKRAQKQPKNKPNKAIKCNGQRIALPARKGAVKQPKNKRKRATGERALFLEIWAERVHQCVNCGVWLGNEPRTHYFSHIKSKGAYPELRLQKSNIRLLCLTCHQAYDFGTQEQFDKLRTINNNENENRT